jgi:cytochrome oxidase Cu insertion factor (SCO1/SenC/PrrC family)
MSGAAPKRSNATLWLIIALAAAPVAASYLLYYFWPPARTVNYGELIETRPLPDPQLTLADGTAFRLSRLRGKWVLVSLDSGRCDERCDRKLLYMRQLRLTQGKDMERVERAWLISDDAVPRPDAVAPYSGTWQVRAAGSGLLESFPAQGAASDHIYVVDPLGNLMMRFPRDPEPGRMIKDLSRLLKASRIG